jgi:myosin heavy subunit
MDDSVRYCFVPDAVNIYKPVEIIGRSGDDLRVIDLVKAADRSKTAVVVVKQHKAIPILSLEEITNPPSDLIKLSDVNRAAILHTLKNRFERDEIYTAVGPILVALNPFKWIQVRCLNHVVFVCCRSSYWLLDFC